MTSYLLFQANGNFDLFFPCNLSVSFLSPDFAPASTSKKHAIHLYVKEDQDASLPEDSVPVHSTRSSPEFILKIGTWNICSLNGKKKELIEMAQEYKLDILGLAETKQKGSGIEDLDDGWKLFYVGVDASAHSQAGVGILISPQLMSKVVKRVHISSRVIIVRLTLPEEKILAIVQVYGPNTDSEYGDFLLKLEDGLSKLSPTDSVILMGDFNAHVGSDHHAWSNVIGEYGDPDVNKSGEKLLDFCESNSLSIMNTFFEHSDRHKYTWYRESTNQKSLIDFIVVSQDLRRYVTDVCIKPRAKLKSTDHRLVVAKFQSDK